MRERRLGVVVHQEHAAAEMGQRAGQVVTGRGLTDPALLVQHRDYGHGPSLGGSGLKRGYRRRGALRTRRVGALRNRPGVRASRHALFNLFQNAKAEGWFDAILIQVQSHPRAIRTMEYADHCDEMWGAHLPNPYPSFEDWRRDADAYVVPAADHSLRASPA